MLPAENAYIVIKIMLSEGNQSLMMYRWEINLFVETAKSSAYPLTHLKH